MSRPADMSEELRKMTAFIFQEAAEKKAEIEAKADADYEIEKRTRVRKETALIDAQYALKLKQERLAQQVARSTVASRARLDLQAARQLLLDNMVDDARVLLRQMADSQDDDNAKARYRAVLLDLLLQGLRALPGEEAVTVSARKADAGAAAEAAAEARQKFKEQSGRDVEIEIDQTSFLKDTSSGGIIVSSASGKIQLNNTFDKRLDLLALEGVPAIRELVFGTNPNRKFDN